MLLDLEREVTAKVFEHLEQFVFTEDVQVSDDTASVAQLGFGPRAAGRQHSPGARRSLVHRLTPRLTP